MCALCTIWLAIQRRHVQDCNIRDDFMQTSLGMILIHLHMIIDGALSLTLGGTTIRMSLSILNVHTKSINHHHLGDNHLASPINSFLVPRGNLSDQWQCCETLVRAIVPLQGRGPFDCTSVSVSRWP